ncbi:hypothetical protein ISN44_As05g028920 [Arabidopsis suecica]|uniref:Uncharacterized protein n=1 Tax=Arabidopsis suecica TaxID=45249 RepID=A0A8T2DN13_ARASU|nr:hypothetical protein ISN44_As05g028920 [Arabidopsis suecica]
MCSQETEELDDFGDRRSWESLTILEIGASALVWEVDDFGYRRSWKSFKIFGCMCSQETEELNDFGDRRSWESLTILEMCARARGRALRSLDVCARMRRKSSTILEIVGELDDFGDVRFCERTLDWERLLSGYRFTGIGIRFCGSVSSSKEVGPLSTIVENDQCECWLILRGTKLGWHYDGLLWPHGEIGTTLSYVVDHVFVMHFSKGNDLCMCEIELGLTVILSLYSARFSLAFKLDFETCGAGVRLTLWMPLGKRERASGLGLYCSALLSAYLVRIWVGFKSLSNRTPGQGDDVGMTSVTRKKLSVSVVAEIQVQETNTRLVTLSHVDLPKRIRDVGKLGLGTGWVVFMLGDEFSLSFATILLSVELGLEDARRVGEIRWRGELEEPEAELGEDDVRSSEVERFVPPPVIADLMRSSMDWILATMRESSASMVDWIVSWWGTGDELATWRRACCNSTNWRLGNELDEGDGGYRVGLRSFKTSLSRKIAGAELSIARTDIVIFYSACPSVDVWLVVTVRRIFTGVLVDRPNDDGSMPVASVRRSFFDWSSLGRYCFGIAKLSTGASCRGLELLDLILRGLLGSDNRVDAFGTGAVTRVTSGAAIGAAAGTATGAAAGGGVVGRAGGGIVGRAGGAARGALVLTP